jgi:hypothetical protein
MIYEQRKALDVDSVIELKLAKNEMNFSDLIMPNCDNFS